MRLSYQNKASQIGWLRTREIYSLMVLETRNPIKASAETMLSPKIQGRILYFIKLPVVASKPWCSLTCRCSFQSQAFLLCVSDCVSSLLIRTLVILVQYDLTELDMTSAKTYLQIRSHSQILESGLQYVLKSETESCSVTSNSL